MIVMKFGGTSVGSAEAIRRLTDIVRGRLDRKPVIVVSAVSGVTNRLIAAAQSAQKRGTEPERAMKELARIHHAILDELRLPHTLIQEPLTRLGEVLKGIYYLRELTPRSLDYVVSFGEIMSSRIVAAYLTAEHLTAKAFTGWDVGIVTDDRYGEAEILPETYPRIRKRFLPEAEKTIAVVTGFIARNKAGERTTLGRGGSDYTAAIIGRGVGAEEIQIWTDVSGILSADPRVVPEAFTLRALTFDEASELAYFGAKVLHPKTIEPAVQADIPVRILNSFKPDDPGTVVTRESDDRAERVVEGLACKRGNSLVNFTSTRMLEAGGYMAQLFDIFRRHNISIDVIATSEVSVSVTVDGSCMGRLDHAMPELRKFSRVRIDPNRAIVCVVGEGMQVVPGIAGRIFKCVGDAAVNIEMISQGSSELNVTFVVTDEDADRAIQALHAEFLTGQERAAS